MSIKINLKQNNEQNKRDTRLDISFSERETGIEFGIAHKPNKIKEESTLSTSCPQKCPPFTNHSMTLLYFFALQMLQIIFL